MRAKFSYDGDLSTDLGMEELMSELYDHRLFTAKDLDIPSRTVSYWKEKEVLTWFPPHKTARFNVLEAAWLLVLRFLQNAGLSIELMKSLTNYFIDEPVNQNLAEKLIKDELKKIVIKTEEDFIKSHRLSYILKSKKNLEQLRREMNYFTQLVKYALISKSQCGIIIDGAKKAYSYTESTFMNPDNLTGLLSNFNIIVPLKPILTELITIDFNKGSYSFPVLSIDENIIIREMRRSDTDNIEIRKMGKVIKIKVATATEVSNEELAHKLMNGSFDGWDKVETSKRDKTKWFVIKKKTIKK
jgi:DNA-binding transcriptional MerR regulator